MKGQNLSEVLPMLARLENVSPEIKLPDGSIDLERVIGDRNKTQEMKCLKSLTIFSILHSDQLFRRTCSEALDLCSYGVIDEVYVRDNKIYLRISDKVAFVCEVPSDYSNLIIYQYGA